MVSHYFRRHVKKKKAKQISRETKRWGFNIQEGNHPKIRFYFCSAFSWSTRKAAKLAAEHICRLHHKTPSVVAIILKSEDMR